MRYSCFLIVLSIFIFSCSSEQNSQKTKKEKSTVKPVSEKDDFKFPEVDSLSNYPNTNFVMTLDEKIDDTKNYMYAASMAFCWDGMKERFNNKIIVQPDADLLYRLHQYIKHKNSLLPDEYDVTIEIDKENRRTRVNAKFSKTLPFYHPLVRFKAKMKFKNTEVEQFGFTGDWEFAYILFYDKNTYALELSPKDENHKIYLYYDETGKYSKFSEAYESMQEKSEKFKKDGKLPGWKRHFEYFDEVRIPVISFHLISDIKELIGKDFFVQDSAHLIIEAWQRNAFVLNENGAKVESESEMTEEAMEEPAEAEQPSPKYFHFNKPFYIFLKRTDADYPYFSLYISNNELLLK